MKIKHLGTTAALAAAAIVVGLSSCAKKDGSGGIAATFKVAKLKTKGTREQAAPARDAVDATKLMSSSSHYSFAVVDGVKFHLTKIQGEGANGDSLLTNYSLTKDIELTGDVSQTVALNEAITWVPGAYRGISLHFTNTWSVKGYCVTGRANPASTTTGTLVYTRAGTIGTVNCATGDCTALPTDYGYHDYNFLSTYSGYASSNDYQQETHYSFNIATTDKPIISMLYDGSYNVACWDGTTWDQSKAISGFRLSVDSTNRPTYYPDGAPAFSIGYLAVFGYVTNDSTEAAPTARTFLASTGAASTLDKTQPTFAFDSLPVVTLVYKADGSIVAGGTRNFQGTGSDQPFDLDLEGFASTTGGGAGQDFYSSGWYYTGSGSPTFVRNRKFTAFNAPATPNTLFTTNATDGAGCGQTLTDFQGNNPSRACLTATPQVVNWKEMVR